MVGLCDKLAPLKKRGNQAASVAEQQTKALMRPVADPKVQDHAKVTLCPQNPLRPRAPCAR